MEEVKTFDKNWQEISSRPLEVSDIDIEIEEIEEGETSWTLRFVDCEDRGKILETIPCLLISDKKLKKLLKLKKGDNLQDALESCVPEEVKKRANEKISK